jgi:hypothetical protein
MNKAYIETVRLLLDAAPVIFETPVFAMKGGTAINLFVQDMPRLSVDIDVVYNNHRTSREEALKFISVALETTKNRLALIGLEAEMSATKEGDEIKLFIHRGRNQVKVEVNHVFRGTVLPVENRRLGNEAQRLFTTDFHSRALWKQAGGRPGPPTSPRSIRRAWNVSANRSYVGNCRVFCLLLGRAQPTGA